MRQFRIFSNGLLKAADAIGVGKTFVGNYQMAMRRQVRMKKAAVAVTAAP